MNRYIKLEAVLDRIAEAYSKHNELVPMWLHIGDIPYADAVEVLRCKDCKYHEELLNGKDGNVICWVHDIDVIVDRNGYCDHGEPKEQEHD